MEKILKALANKRRLKILKYLRDRKEASVGEISAKIRLSFRATSKHLLLLQNAGIVDKEQRSLSMYYFLNPETPLARIIRVVVHSL